MDENCSEVWKSVCSRWKPVLSAANQVRSFCIPPKGRTATLPSGSRLQGQPQCSNCSSSAGAARTKSSTGSGSASQSEPLIVSWMCSSRESLDLITPPAPPSAETVWLRMGLTLETMAIFRRGYNCAGLRAAANDQEIVPQDVHHVRLALRSGPAEGP